MTFFMIVILFPGFLWLPVTLLNRPPSLNTIPLYDANYEISQMFGKANYVWLKRYFIHHISFAQWELRKFCPPPLPFAFLSVSWKSLLASTSVWTFSIVASSVSITVWHRWRTFVNVSVENVQNHAMCMNTLAYDLGTLSV